MRYIYDEERGLRYKTVELIEAQIAWQPTIDIQSKENRRCVWVKVAYGETALRQELRKVDARWCPQRKLWQVERGIALAMGLADRINGE